MFERIRAWRQERRAKGAAVERAVTTFRATRGVDPMGAHVLLHEPQQTIVRVMYYAGHIPPARAWYAVSADEVRELSYDDVAHLEGPWR
jgi:hypothetical protein